VSSFSAHIYSRRQTHFYERWSINECLCNLVYCKRQREKAAKQVLGVHNKNNSEAPSFEQFLLKTVRRNDGLVTQTHTHSKKVEGIKNTTNSNNSAEFYSLLNNTHSTAKTITAGGSNSWKFQYYGDPSLGEKDGQFLTRFRSNCTSWAMQQDKQSVNLSKARSSGNCCFPAKFSFSRCPGRRLIGTRKQGREKLTPFPLLSSALLLPLLHPAAPPRKGKKGIEMRTKKEICASHRCLLASPLPTSVIIRGKKSGTRTCLHTNSIRRRETHIILSIPAEPTLNVFETTLSFLKHNLF